MCVCVGLSLRPLQHTYLPTKSNKTSTESSNSVVLVTASYISCCKTNQKGNRTRGLRMLSSYGIISGECVFTWIWLGRWTMDKGR